MSPHFGSSCTLGPFAPSVLTLARLNALALLFPEPPAVLLCARPVLRARGSEPDRWLMRGDNTQGEEQAPGRSSSCREISDTEREPDRAGTQGRRWGTGPGREEGGQSLDHHGPAKQTF